MLRVLWASVILASALFPTPVSAQAQRDEEVSVRAAALACQANLEGFQYYNCHFTLTLAVSSSPDLAKAGRYSNARQLDHVLIVDGSKERFETLGNAAKVAIDPAKFQPMGGKLMGATVDFLPVAHLKFGDESLHYFESVQTADLYGKDFPDHLISDAPLSMFLMGFRFDWSPASLLQKVGQQTLALKVHELVQDQGRPALRLGFADLREKDQGFIAFEYFLDPQRGYLPLHIVRRIKQDQVRVLAEVFLLDAQECGAGRWFPTRVVAINGSGPKPIGVREIRVTQLETKRRPVDEDFVLSIPAGTRIKSPLPGPLPGFVLRRGEKVNANDIPRLFQMLEQSGNHQPMDTAIHPRSWWTPARVWTFVTAALCAALGGILVYRNRHHITRTGRIV